MRLPISLLLATTVTTATLGLLIAAPRHAAAQAPTTTTINFDNVEAGTVVNTTYSTLGITFQGQGAFASDVTAEDVTSLSAPNALDATSGAIDVRFTGLYPGGINAFSFVSLADPSGFGSDAVAVQFFGLSDNLLFTSANYDQTVTQTLSFTNLVGVKRITLAADAYYDNITFTGVAAPEPGTLAQVGLGLLLLGGVTIRRRRTACKG
ncbi:MAG: PEP-CTERM sorting domain-containing protein [Cytophagales bacterium]|nr:PEP-CTERM sorting domain-containing protein [Armatimonadota bacterium]